MLDFWWSESKWESTTLGPEIQMNEIVVDLAFGIQHWRAEVWSSGLSKEVKQPKGWVYHFTFFEHCRL